MTRKPDPAVLDALSAVEPLAEPGDVRVRDRCLATRDAERYADAQAAIPEVSVEVVDDARQLAELARSYSTVVALDEAFAGVDIEGDVRVEPNASKSPNRSSQNACSPSSPATAPDTGRRRGHRVADLDAPWTLRRSCRRLPSLMRTAASAATRNSTGSPLLSTTSTRRCRQPRASPTTTSARPSRSRT